MTINKEELKPIVYALTLEDRPAKRDKWLSRGFKITNTKPNLLLDYWHCRLEKGEERDIDMHKKVLARYRSVMDKKEQPSTLAMIGSAATAVTKWVSSGARNATEEQIEIRKNICKGCEFWDSVALNNTGRCTKCGCSTWAKIRLATEACPIGKWQEIPE